MVFTACEDYYTEMNQNPNGVDLAESNPNLMMTGIMQSAARSYLGLGYGNLAGAMQHTQKDGWHSSHNVYDWGPTDWTGWYNMLRDTEFMLRRSKELEWDFHEGVALTMKAFIFGNVTDFWGDAPYTEALRGDRDIVNPIFDPQEVIYNGIISDLNAAVQKFATGNTLGLITQNDIYYGGNVARWERFANSLLLRYYMRISEKLPSVAQQGIERIYASGIYMQSTADDANMDLLGNISQDSWPENVVQSSSAGSEFRRIKPCATLVNTLYDLDDPRLHAWFRPVHCRWVEDPTLPTAIDEFIRENGVLLEGRRSFLDIQYLDRIAEGNVYTRHFNPDLKAADPVLANVPIDTREIVGIPPGLITPDGFNLNPTVGQTIENQHVSQLADMFRQASGEFLKARILSAAEVHYILAEAAIKGWSVGSGQQHYEKAVELSLQMWGLGNQYGDYISKAGVAYEGNVEQVLVQKWIASWTSASESWNDFKRTGYPQLQAGPASRYPAVAVRFPYGNDEINYNNRNTIEAVGRLEITQFGQEIGDNNQWAKPWLMQGTGRPW